jgi:hypothetical protein
MGLFPVCGGRRAFSPGVRGICGGGCRVGFRFRGHVSVLAVGGLVGFGLLALRADGANSGCASGVTAV